MSEWLLIIVLTSGLWGDGMPVSGITMHDFPSRELCESAASQAKEGTGVAATFSYKCLKKDGGKWVDDEKLSGLYQMLIQNNLQLKKQ